MRAPRKSAQYVKLRTWVIRNHPPVCVLCRRPVDVTLPGTHPMGPSLEHPQSLCEGGAELDPDNAALAHLGCNSAKENRRRAVRRRQAAALRPSRAW